MTAEQIRALLPLRSGEIANGMVIDKWLDELEKTYRNQGYVGYSADDEQEIETAVGDSNVISFKIKIDEGPQFKVGSINFHGRSDISEKNLRDTLVLQAGGLCSQEQLESSIENLNKLGLSINKDEDIRFSSDEEHRLVNIVIALDTTTSHGDLPKKHLFESSRRILY